MTETGAHFRTTSPLVGAMKTIKKKLSNLKLPFIGTSSNTNNPSEATTPPENILAFRTITTMLSHIQEGTTFSDSRCSVSKELGRELEILNALSTVIVRDVEIVAVTAKPDNGSGKLEVICTCTHPVNQLTSPQTNTGYLSRFFAIANPRRDEVLSLTPPPTNSPTISEPKAPDLKGTTLWQYIEDHWRVQLNNSVLADFTYLPCHIGARISHLTFIYGFSASSLSNQKSMLSPYSDISPRHVSRRSVVE
jgi:hypothetical protein